MKTMRNLTTLAGIFVVFLTLTAAGARGQVIDVTHFTGTFTLPYAAQWGTTVLPAGEYTLKYGFLDGGVTMVEVIGKEKGNLHKMIPTGPADRTSAKKNSLLCIRAGDALIVRALEMPVIGESVRFAMPHGTQLMAQERSGSKNIQLAEGAMFVQRVPVSLVTK